MDIGCCSSGSNVRGFCSWQLIMVMDVGELDGSCDTMDALGEEAVDTDTLDDTKVSLDCIIVS